MISSKKQALLRLHRLLQFRFHAAIAAGKSFSEVKSIYVKMKAIYMVISLPATTSSKVSIKLLRKITSTLVKTSMMGRESVPPSNYVPAS
jgi:hypothetical protein